jgi:hypothetical protein
VIRAEEYAGAGPDGIEQPRPTDPEPAAASWDLKDQEPELDDGLVLDPEAPITPTQAAERLALRSLAYSGERFPADVLRDSRRAVETHPDVLLLPTAFRVLESDGDGWRTGGGMQATIHGTRRTLEFGLTWFEPRRLGLIPFDADRDTDARTVLAAGAETGGGELAAYVRAADQLREGRANQVEVDGTVHRICRVRRLVRWSPDGPEGPRPSDVDSHPPERIRPVLDEDGTIHHES